MMEPFPRSIIRRELGWSLHKRPELDSRRLMASLHCNPEDKIPLMSSLPDPEDDEIPNMFDNEYINELPVYNMEFAPPNLNANLLAVVDEVGNLTIMNTKEGSVPKIVSRIRAHSNAVFGLAWNNIKNDLIVTGGGDQSVKLWTLTPTSLENISTFKGHQKTVKNISFHPSTPTVFASGGRDGAIMIWDTRCDGNENPENLISNAHHIGLIDRIKINDRLNVVTDLVFQNDNTLISSGSNDGLLKFWDMRKSYKFLKNNKAFKEFKLPLKNSSAKGCSALRLDQLHNLYACSVSNEIFKYNLCTNSELPESTYTSASRGTFYIKHDISSDGRYLAVGSENPYIQIWDMNDVCADPFLMLRTIASPLSCPRFAPDNCLKLAAGGDDGFVNIWRYDTAKKKINPSGLAVKLRTEETSSRLRLSPKEFIPVYKKMTLPPANTFNMIGLLKDLPNFIIDGRLPHLAGNERLKNKKLNWLGEISKGLTIGEKRALTPPVSTNINTNETPPKKLKILSKADQITPKRVSNGRRSRRETQSPTSSFSSSNIHRFFSPSGSTQTQVISPLGKRTN